MPKLFNRKTLYYQILFQEYDITLESILLWDIHENLSSYLYRKKSNNLNMTLVLNNFVFRSNEHLLVAKVKAMFYIDVV